jgi:SagB-type dehydrogenase family enzyme
MHEGIGDTFQVQTRYDRNKPPAGRKPIRLAPLYKTYAGVHIIALSKPEGGAISLDEALHRRTSVRDFSNTPLDESALSYLLWASTGIQRHEFGYAFRTSPSAGALYPIETYVVLNNVKTLAPGVYHYNIQTHSLEQLRTGDYGRSIAQAALNQRMCVQAAAVFVWTAVYDRSKGKYLERAYRYIYMEAGHIAQNLALASVSLGLGSCQVAAFYDSEVETIIEVDGKVEGALYLSVVGHPR